MYGALIGELAALPYEYRQADLADRSIPLLTERPQEGGPQAGRDYSGTLVLAAAAQEGILRFERRLPALLKAGRTVEKKRFEALFGEELASSLRQFGKRHPLAGYPMELSIWLLREGGSGEGRPSKAEDPGAAVRACAAAWAFQDDLYMMRHMARTLAGTTCAARESVKAADAAACAAFLALHGCTKDYIARYMRKQFGYAIPDEAALKKELLAASGDCPPSLAVRAALCGFFYGRDYEDALRRAVGAAAGIARENVSVIGSLAGAFAEAGYGVPDELVEICRRRLPDDLGDAADSFKEEMEQRKKRRQDDPKAMARWEGALSRASSLHPAAVQGNEPLERALRELNEKKDRQSFVTALEILRLRMNLNARVFVPIAGAARGGEGTEDALIGGDGNEDAVRGGGEAADAPDRSQVKNHGSREREAFDSGARASENAVLYRMQAVRIRDGSLWQPVYTGRAQLEKAGASADLRGNSGLVLSYALRPLLARFLPAQPAPGQSPPTQSAPAGAVPPEIRGIVINPFDCPLFLPRKTIEALFRIDREAKDL